MERETIKKEGTINVYKDNIRKIVLLYLQDGERTTPYVH